MNDNQQQKIIKQLLQNKEHIESIRHMMNGHSDVTKHLMEAELSILIASDHVKKIKL